MTNPHCMKSDEEEEEEKDTWRGWQEPRCLTVTIVTSQLNQIAQSDSWNHGTPKEKLKSWEQLWRKKCSKCAKLSSTRLRSRISDTRPVEEGGWSETDCQSGCSCCCCDLPGIKLVGVCPQTVMRASEMFSVLPLCCHFFSELLSFLHCVSNCVSELSAPEDTAQFKIKKKGGNKRCSALWNVREEANDSAQVCRRGWLTPSHHLGSFDGK